MMANNGQLVQIYDIDEYDGFPIELSRELLRDISDVNLPFLSEWVRDYTKREYKAKERKREVGEE